MSRPKLPSELHPDYPKQKCYVELSDRTTRQTRWEYSQFYKLEAYAEFYAKHPEFDNEGEYIFVCPFCGDPNSYIDEGGYCCGEVGHCEWEYFSKEEL